MSSYRFWKCVVSATLGVLTLCLTSTSIQADIVVTSFQFLPALGGGTVEAYKVNDTGQVVGTSYTSNGNIATLWSGGTATNLGTFGGNSAGIGINHAGHVVGVSNRLSGERRAALWSGGTITDLGTLGGNSFALGINDSGQIAGFSNTSNGSRATLWNHGTISDLGILGGVYVQSRANDINNAGQVVGVSQNQGGGGDRATLWSDGNVIDLGSLGEWSEAHGINDSGQIVGYSQSLDFGRATLWSHGEIIDLGTVGGDYASSFARDINDSGMIVGVSFRSASELDNRATLWSDGNAYDLQMLASEWTNASMNEARSISNVDSSGRFYIVGTSSQGHFLMQLQSPAAVPEPSTLAMMGIVSVGLAIKRLRRKR